VVSFGLRQLYSQEKSWMGGWVGSIAGLGNVVKREIPSPYPDSNL
jgi:hypothetical protein